MRLLLHIDTKSDIDTVLNTIYAFTPTYQFKHIGNGVLEVAIDAATPFSDQQWNIIETQPYTITFVLPPPNSPPTS